VLGTAPANLNLIDRLMSSIPISRFRLAKRIAFFLLPLLFACPVLRAQDAVRPSLAGEASAEARRQSIEKIPYNLLAGPIRFRFSATFGVECNDNINLAEVNEQDDFIIRPQLNVNAIWPITQLNTLKLDLGIGYSFYVDHPSNDTDGVLIAPGSAIAFDIFVGDFRINFHDRMSLEQDPVSEIALSNVVDYGRFQNTAGVSVLWDLNKAVATFGYDHYNYVSTTSAFDYLNRNAEELSGSLYVTATNTTGIGVESSYVFTYYDQGFLNDSSTVSIGAFAETQVTNYLKVRVAGGYQGIWFDNGGGVMDSSDLNDFYANILISHRVNAVLTHSVSAGHETQLGLNSNYIMLNYVRYTASWNIIRNTLLSTEFFYEDADDSGGIFSEHAQRYGGAVTIGYQFTQHVTLGARYQYTQKDSDQPLRGYEQNRISLDGTYSF
jgi:putative beta-barrel porin BBP2